MTKSNQAYRQALAFWYPERGEAGLSHQGVTEEGGRSFDVVRIIDVSFDGRPAIPVFFDTGGLNALVPSVVERFGLKAEGNLQVRGGGEGSEDLALTRVGEIRIGDVYLKNQGFFVFPLQGLEKVEGVPVNGLIGYEVFKRFVVRLDDARKQATFFLPQAFQAEAGGTAVPFTFEDRTPQIEGEIDGLRGHFTVDTGSRASLTLNRPFSEKNGLQAKYGAKHEAMSGWGVGGGVRSRFARGGMLKMGTVEVPAPLLDLSLNEKGAFANPYLAGNIGAGVLKRFTVTFDYGHKKIYLAPNESFAKPDNGDRSGLWLNLEGDGYRIEEVVAASPAAEAGLAVGDTIVKVGDQAAADLLLSDFRLRLREGDTGARVALTIRKADGTTREVSLELRDLL